MHGLLGLEEVVTDKDRSKLIRFTRTWTKFSWRIGPEPRARRARAVDAEFSRGGGTLDPFSRGGYWTRSRGLHSHLVFTSPYQDTGGRQAPPMS